MERRNTTHMQTLPLTELTAISILDGRNRKDVAEIAPYVSEFNIIRTRVEVEAQYVIALSGVGVVRLLSRAERRKLTSFGNNLTLEEAQKIKMIENETQHDVKAMERAFRVMLQGTSLEDLTEMVHFGLTSEDINNLAYRLILKRATTNVLIPAVNAIINALTDRAEKYKETPMLARTHGQAAVPTTLGHEFAVFAQRLNKQTRALETLPLQGKLTGAVGTFNALYDQYPDVDWLTFAEKFVKSFGLKPNLVTTQIAPNDDIAEYFQTYLRINNILLDFDQDAWRYISDHWFTQEVITGTVGSSTMPQKVNPIRFENSEGNLGKANALFEFFSRKLPISRLQRDLSDSTVIRDMGVPLGWSLLAYKNTLAGLARVWPNLDLIAEILNSDWSILAEAAQTRMRAYGVEDPYAIMKDFTQGKRIGEDEWTHIVDQLPIGDKQKKDLRNLTPGTYIGLAIQITKQAIEEIRSSKKR